MLSVYARHSSDCPRVNDGTWKRCKCPKWIWGTLPNGDFVRRSAKTRSWEHAEELRRELESQVETVSPSAALPRISGFFFWASVRRGYITQNPTLDIGRIKVVHVPTDYFPRDEFNKIIEATYAYGDPRGGFIPVEDLRLRLRVMTWLMRWSGLRIRDAVTLQKDRLQGDSLFLYQAKTGTPVYVPLPPHVVQALKDLPPGPRPNPRYFFWSGNGDPKSAVANWQRSYRRLFEIAALTRADGSSKRCHPHMFRDTFAVENLLAGVPIDQVSLLLGHKSVKITEKSYAPFVKARQLQLQESVRNAWEAVDPTITQQVLPSPETTALVQ